MYVKIITLKQIPGVTIFCYRTDFYVIMGGIASEITSLTIVYLPFIQTQIKENIKARVTGLCVGN